MRSLVLLLVVGPVACFTDATGGGSGTGGDEPCPEGSAGCPCYGNLTCDAPLSCEGGTCFDPACIDGTASCRCYPNATCNAGLACNDSGVCRPPTGDGGSTGDSDTAPSTTGDTGSTCYAVAPPGWSGPYVARTGSGPGACEPPFMTVVTEAEGDWTLTPSTCQCDCDADAPSCSVDLVHFADPGCEVEDTVSMYNGEDCTGFPGALGCVRVSGVGSINGFTCLPTTTVVPGDATPGPAVTVCATAPVGCENGGSLLPPVSAAFDVGVCIQRDGAHPCPDGPYSEQRLLYRSAEGEPACDDTCTCTGAASGTCAGVMSIYDDCAQTTLLGSIDHVVIGATASLSAGTVTSAAIVYDADVEDGCDPGSPPGIVDDFAPSDPLTLCCAAP